MCTQKTLLAIATGVVIGAAAGILFAPEKGEVIRGKLKDRSTDAAEKFGQKFNETRDNVMEKIKKGSEKAEHVAKQTAANAKKAAS